MLVKFKFSEDKKTSWILLDDEWVELETKLTDSYYYLSGLLIKKECREYDKTGNNPIVHKYIVPFNYIIDRNTLSLYSKVKIRVDMSDKGNLYSSWTYIYDKGKDLERFKFSCTVSKIQF